MGLIQNHRHQRLIRPLIFMLMISTHFRLVAEGRSQPNDNRADQKTTRSEIRTHMIGSRPPRCQLRCSGCSPCEAVQVPVTPPRQLHRSRRFTIYETPDLLYSRGDDVTNYKPMGWKCKCGNLFFNP